MLSELVLSLLMISEVRAASTISVRPKVNWTAKGDPRLSDLVDVQNLSPAAVAELEGVRIPLLGRSMIPSEDLRHHLRPVVQAERARTGQNVTLKLPDQVSLLAQNDRPFTPEEVIAVLKAAWQPLCEECELEFQKISLPAIAHVIDWSLKPSTDLPKGGFTVPVELIKESGPAASAWVTGRLVIKRKVPVAKRMLSMQEQVAASDYTWEYKDTTLSYDGIPTVAELSGRRLKRAIRAGDVIWLSNLERQKAIRAGQPVQVRSKAAGWEVSLTVVAQQDAHVGDVIQLKNPKSNSVLIGSVVGPGEVEIQ